ncbi:alpha-ketoglutarate-dependent dioxygenase AlkB family protein [Marinihelvus fidelis]|nr:alpha-ketoglutarate-dependent dioxygenase AlkB [Marinihelvus fidelis]
MTEFPGFSYTPSFIPAGQADVLFTALWANTPWEQLDIVLFGRTVRQPRLTAWYAERGVRYRYSGLEMSGDEFPADIADLAAQLDQHLGVRFNAVLLNAYRDGDDAMGWHADDEPELGAQPVIASVSLGATRVMRVRHGKSGPSTGLSLENGSLLVMSGDSQANFRHSIPRTRQPVGRRINLTFRRVAPAGAPRPSRA